jgi:hypothetical protein
LRGLDLPDNTYYENTMRILGKCYEIMTPKIMETFKELFLENYTGKN